MFLEFETSEKKLDFRTINSNFIVYQKKSKGYRFYYPTHSMRIICIDNVRFIKNGEISGSDKSHRK